MEQTYKIKQCDNGWVLENPENLTSFVVEEKENDIKHNKIKQQLGEWLYDDINYFCEENETVDCVVKIKIVDKQ